MSYESVVEPDCSLKNNLWLKILDETAAATNGKNAIDGCTMLIVGDKSSGKTQLLSNISPISLIPSKQGAGLQFIPIDIHDMSEETHESLGILNCWILEGDLAFENLIQYAIRPETLIKQKLLLVICIDMSQPWYCMKNLQKWTTVVQNYIQQLNLPIQDLDQMKEDFYQQYNSRYSSKTKLDNIVEPRLITTTNDKADQPLQQLSSYDENHYFGFPVIVVGTKTDTFSSLEMNYKINGDIQDLIQIHLREFCLKLGASLIYTSTNNETNNSLIYKYITKLLYNFKLNEVANITERDSIFIPLGWDSTTKVDLLKETITSLCPDDSLDVYLNPPFDKSKVADTTMTTIMDDEEFYGTLEKNLANTETKTNNNSLFSFVNPNESHSRQQLDDNFDTTSLNSSLFPSPSNRTSNTTTGGVINSPTISSRVLSDDGLGRMSDKTSGELANFFSTLLSSKMTSSPGSKPK